MRGFAWRANCKNNALEFANTSNATDDFCVKNKNKHTQKLDNRLFVRAEASDDTVDMIAIERKPCSEDPLFIFGFYDSKADPRGFTLENLIKNEPVGVPYEKLQTSKHYKEIVKFAESIKLYD